MHSKTQKTNNTQTIFYIVYSTHTDMRARSCRSSIVTLAGIIICIIQHKHRQTDRDTEHTSFMR